MRALASTLKESSAVAAVRGRHAFSVRRLGSYSSSSAAHRQSSHDSDEKPHYDAKRRKKKAYYILGPDLPDIWPPLHPNPCALSAPQPRGCDELIPKIIDGKSIARDIRLGIAEEVRYMKETVEKVPGLAVVLVGQRRDSQSYVRFKIKACQEVGIRSLIAELREDCNENEVINAVSSFNTDPSIHGILVQLPLPQFLVAHERRENFEA